MPDPLSIQPQEPAAAWAPEMRHVLAQRRMVRLLAFSGRSIDDVVNCGVSKRLVAGYFKLEKTLARQLVTAELELQWNPMRLRW